MATWTPVARALSQPEANWAYSRCSIEVLIDFYHFFGPTTPLLAWHLSHVRTPKSVVCNLASPPPHWPCTFASSTERPRAPLNGTLLLPPPYTLTHPLFYFLHRTYDNL